MKIGYARVSTVNQNLEIQIDALKNVGCEKIFQEKVSGKKTDRPELHALLEFIREKDELVVYDLSRLGRTTLQVLELIESFDKRNIGFKSLREGIDITTPLGKAITGVLAVFNQMNIEVQNEKIKEGLINARARGRKGGRPKISKDTRGLVETMYQSKEFSIKKICELTGVSERSIYNIINERIEEVKSYE